MIWKRKEYSVVIIESFVEEKTVAFGYHTFNVMVVSIFAKHIEGLLCRLAGPVQNSSRLMGFAVLFVCVPMAFLAVGVAVESLDVAGNRCIGGTVAAGTNLSGITLVTEGTSSVVRRRHCEQC